MCAANRFKFPDDLGKYRSLVTMPAASKINPDLEEERKKVAFNVEEFTNWYHGGADKVADKRFLGEK